MKANRNAKNQTSSDSGASGIGTMIVFIALVITAAVAAAVLINTSNTLQRKASETGTETTQEVAANLFIRDIIGEVDAGTSNIDHIAWYLSLAPGADPIDLSNLVIRWKHSTDLLDMEINAVEIDCDVATPAALDEGFCIREVVDAGDADLDVLSEGDRVRLEIFIDPVGPPVEIEVGTRDTVDALLLPETGAPVLASFKTPATFGTNTYLSLI